MARERSPITDTQETADVHHGGPGGPGRPTRSDGSEDMRGPGRVPRAVTAADDAFGSWSDTPASERGALLLQAAQNLVLRTGQVVETMAAEVGASGAWASFNVKVAAQTLIEAAGAATQPIGQVLPVRNTSTDAHSMHIRTPVGVVAAITPWHASLVMAARAVALPLALGNTVVLKPSAETPLSGGTVLREALTAAGLPEGVLGVVTHRRGGAAEVVHSLVTDPCVRAVHFTGSAAVGRAVAMEAARHCKPTVLELGGKNSLLVMEDADVDHAVEATVAGAFMNAGQSCLSIDRVIVQRPLAERFLEGLRDRVNSLPPGGPAWPADSTTPMTGRTAQRVSALVAVALAKGATAVTGTGAVEGPGTSIAPVVLTDVTPRMRIWSQEIFGPVVVVHTVDGADQAVALANEDPCGPTAGVVTGDWAAGLGIARRLRAGAVHVNDKAVGGPQAVPFGGIRDSGYGRVDGRGGIDAFTDTRWITLGAEGRPALPF
jgi:acyl-CoA reductase-like NAD-dependent aldehyde dehydrogenase